ncbi:PREDICTED: probable xyloglucan endotransglucosylase/hydrolase protein 26 [Tarenaya hassleriana]|uniref:probable xyloglucan endotransglucosylase/hydrolase protein 26 n=1 Tax=Tarenaya hassleriana TaxID=28532 RepID=UPI00053C5979|nr:PREDICTED: probable xyloglucan endotransglucosylase/hydrolase protein 26 [Tarenaya hassleriana]
MAGFRALLFALAMAFVCMDRAFVGANFSKNMIITWGKQHVNMSGDNLSLVLDKSAGSAVRSKAAYLFGSIEMLIKLVPGNSAGTVTAYYLSSSGNTHDEIDFEFLGNTSGQPYTIHTNIYTQGKGNREKQFRPWFNPTDGFHNYTIHWNPSEVVWYVDGTPIRVFRNYEKEGVPYPNEQGMKVFVSLWNADDWATQGGRVKTDWTQAPFVAECLRFRPKACKWKGPVSISECAALTRANWWTSPSFSQLSSDQLARMQQIQTDFMIYDYCKDTNRFQGVMPPECSMPQF